MLAGMLAGVLVSPVGAVAGPMAPALTPSVTPTPTATITPAVPPTSLPTAQPTSQPTSLPTALPTTLPVGGAFARLLGPASAVVPGLAPALPWPKQGRARMLVPGLGTLGYSGTTTLSVPIASVTKVMTAYTVLRDHPLTTRQQGPKVTVLKAEAQAYPKRKAAGESVVKIKAGERLTERQLLEGLLIASGNNFADLLARWDAGSSRAFVSRMNANAAALGMTGTHVVDADGLSPNSRSSAVDLLKLAPLAMADPTFAQIVAEPKAKIPYVTLKTTNRLLGTHTVIGIKTGSTRAAGGCLLFAARKTLGGRVFTVYGVVLGAPGPLILTNALKESDKLVVAAGKALRSVTVLTAGTPVASLVTADGRTVQLAPARNLVLPGWAGMRYRLALPAGLLPGQLPATLYAYAGTGLPVSVPLIPLPAL
jgi:D-alanyl-D-alanine carboxypeptidase (penicillin-binding protein 5/6)